MVEGTREVAHVRGHAEAGVAAGVVRCRMIDWPPVNHYTSDDGSLTMAAQYLEYLRSLKIASSPFDATQSGFEQSSPYPQLRSVDYDQLTTAAMVNWLWKGILKIWSWLLKSALGSVKWRWSNLEVTRAMNQLPKLGGHARKRIGSTRRPPAVKSWVVEMDITLGDVHSICPEGRTPWQAHHNLLLTPMCLSAVKTTH